MRPSLIESFPSFSFNSHLWFSLFSQVKSRAMELAREVQNEDGVAAAVDAFHRHLPPELPLPPTMLDEPDNPNPFHWLLSLFEKCCPPFAS